MLSLRSYYLYQQGENIDNVITRNCLYPNKIKVTDSLGKVHDMYVPCGKCICCQDKKRNEWVSRMSLHSLTHKYCYFITLTYGSYNLYDFDNHPFKEDWLLTKPRLSTNNYKGIPKYMPSLLRQEHLTKFFKRLRVLLNFDFSYCAAGEYGDKYLRPHFHVILWSDSPITYQNIVEAWSYKCYQYSAKDVRRYNGKQSKDGSFRFLIGRVDYNDLVANGTLNYDAVDNSKNLNSSHVFSYVAKYVAKRNNVTSRLRDHILQEYDRFDHVSWYEDTADNNAVIESINRRRAYCDYYGIEYSAKSTLGADFFDDNSRHLITLTYNQKHYENVNQDEFVKIFSPFFVCSRARAIGRKYYEENFERFQAKCFELPKFHNKNLAFPSYFFRLLKNEKYPVHFRQKSLQSVSYSRDFIPCVRDLYLAFREDKDIYYNSKSALFLKKFGLHKMSKDGLFSPTFINNLGYVTYYYSPTYDIFEGFKYDRFSKEYVFFDYYDRLDFCDYIVSNLNQQISDIKKQNETNALLTKFQDELLCLPSRDSLVSSFIDRRSQLTQKYKIQKTINSKL